MTAIHPIPHAPGRSATRAEGAMGADPYPLPGGIDMHDLTDPPQPDTVRGRQLAAVLVVGKLLELDLPEACDLEICSNDTIMIQLSARNDPIDALTRWADFLGAAPRANGTPYDCQGRRRQNVQITSVYRDHKIRVYDGLLVDEIPSEWLADREAS